MSDIKKEQTDISKTSNEPVLKFEKLNELSKKMIEIIIFGLTDTNLAYPLRLVVKKRGDMIRIVPNCMESSMWTTKEQLYLVPVSLEPYIKCEVISLDSNMIAMTESNPVLILRDWKQHLKIQQEHK